MPDEADRSDSLGRRSFLTAAVVAGALSGAAAANLPIPPRSSGRDPGRPGSSLDIRDFGVAGDGVQDDAPAVRSAVAAASAQGGGAVYLPPTPRGYGWGGPVVLPSRVALIGTATRLLGDGGSQPMIVSGRVSDDGATMIVEGEAGALDRLQHAAIAGFRFERENGGSGGSCVHLHNVNESCFLRDLHFSVGRSATALHLSNCFYTDLQNVFVRGSNSGESDGNGQVGIILGPEANAVGMRRVTAAHCDTGIRFAGGRGQVLEGNCTVEGCRVGLHVASPMQALSLRGLYVEANREAGIRLSNGAEAIDLDGCYFYGERCAVDLQECFRVTVGAANHFDPSCRVRVRTAAGSVGVRVLLGMVPRRGPRPEVDPAWELTNGVAMLEYSRTSFDVFSPTPVERVVWFRGRNQA